MTASSYQVKARLRPYDYIHVKRLARQYNVPITDIVRRAIRQFLESEQQAQRNEIESIYAQQLRASTNRICGLLAKLAMDNKTVVLFLGQLVPTCIISRSLDEW